MVISVFACSFHFSFQEFHGISHDVKQLLNLAIAHFINMETEMKVTQLLPRSQPFKVLFLPRVWNPNSSKGKQDRGYHQKMFISTYCPSDPALAASHTWSH